MNRVCAAPKNGGSGIVAKVYLPLRSCSLGRKDFQNETALHAAT